MNKGGSPRENGRKRVALFRHSLDSRRRRLSTRSSFRRGTQKIKKKKEKGGRKKKADLFPKPVISLSRVPAIGCKKEARTGPRRERRCFHEDVVEDRERLHTNQTDWWNVKSNRGGTLERGSVRDRVNV